MGDISRNDPCPCGSGTKYKNCHLGREHELTAASRARPFAIILASVSALGLGGLVFASKGIEAGAAVAIGGLMLVGIVVALWRPPPPGEGGDAGAINFGK